MNHLVCQVVKSKRVAIAGIIALDQLLLSLMEATSMLGSRR